jgi:hypothetical protein
VLFLQPLPNKHSNKTQWKKLLTLNNSKNATSFIWRKTKLHTDTKDGAQIKKYKLHFQIISQPVQKIFMTELIKAFKPAYLLMSYT